MAIAKLREDEKASIADEPGVALHFMTLTPLQSTDVILSLLYRVLVVAVFV